MVIIQNLLLIAGTGTRSGKTTMACRIIHDLKELKIVAIKITPHFHETTPGLASIERGGGYEVYEETDTGSSKDTSRMLKAGAHRVYFAKVLEDQLLKVFEKITGLIPAGTPVICESPALRNFVVPGVFIIMTSNTINKEKNISHLQSLPHLMFQLGQLDSIETLPVGFAEGKWFVKG